jgi:polar amino acid transport system substrate-binding protein
MLLLLNVSHLAFAQKNLLFCYEDKSLPPYFLGEGAVVPKTHPGATIELMQQIDLQFTDLTIKYIRKPWKRCLDDLSKSTVDAVIGSHHIEREKIGVYPRNNGKVDPTKAISEHAVCFIKHKASAFSWDGTNIQGNKEMVIAVTAGYMIIKVLEQLPVIIHETLSADQALILLKKKRVDAAVSLCQINKYAMKQPSELESEFTLVYPPLHVNSGYLIVSHGYYKTNATLVKSIWHYLINLDTDTIYNKYNQ